MRGYEAFAAGRDHQLNGLTHRVYGPSVMAVFSNPFLVSRRWLGSLSLWTFPAASALWKPSPARSTAERLSARMTVSSASDPPCPLHDRAIAMARMKTKGTVPLVSYSKFTTAATSCRSIPSRSTRVASGGFSCRMNACTSHSHGFLCGRLRPRSRGLLAVQVNRGRSMRCDLPPSTQSTALANECQLWKGSVLHEPDQFSHFVLVGHRTRTRRIAGSHPHLIVVLVFLWSGLTSTV